MVLALERTIKLTKKQKGKDVTINLPDVNPDMSMEQLRKFFMDVHPEIATAMLQGPIPTATGVEYLFSPAAGEKG